MGAGITTVLLLGAISLTARQEKVTYRNHLGPLFVVFVTAAALLIGTLDMPLFGDPAAPIHQHVAPHYINESPAEIGPVPNVVTSVLASYRGYDTLGETTVIFTAGVGTILLLGSIRRRNRRRDGEEDE